MNHEFHKQNLFTNHKSLSCCTFQQLFEKLAAVVIGTTEVQRRLLNLLGIPWICWKEDRKGGG